MKLAKPQLMEFIVRNQEELLRRLTSIESALNIGCNTLQPKPEQDDKQRKDSALDRMADREVEKFIKSINKKQNG
jgi:hypothetical protein